MAFDLQTQLAKFLQQLYAGNVSFTAQGLAGDGTSLLPAYSFTSEPTLGFWRSASGVVTVQGSLATTAGLTVGATFNLTAGNMTLPAANRLVFNGIGHLGATANGVWLLANNAETTGSQLKVDALPTVASGFGGSPAITAGSTPLAGSVDVGTGGAATSGVINFNGTAFPSAPFVVACNKTTNAVVRAVATTTQLTLSSTTAWGANDIVSWICISSK